MRKFILLGAFLTLLIVIAIGMLSQKEYEETPLMKLREKYSRNENPSVDHSKFSQLQKKFATPQAVTVACVSCHNLTAQQVMNGNIVGFLG